MELFIKDGHVRTESKQGPMSSIMLYSDADKTLTTLTDMQGVKEGRVSQNAIKENKDISVEYLNEEKSILGYSCKKAILKSTKGGNVEQRTVWYLPDKVLSFVYDFGIAGLNKVNGLPLEYENVFNGIKMVHRVVELDFNRQIDDQVFTIPSGYNLK